MYNRESNIRETLYQKEQKKESLTEKRKKTKIRPVIHRRGKVESKQNNWSDGDGHVPGGKVEGIACVLKESAFLNRLFSRNVLSYI